MPPRPASWAVALNDHVESTLTVRRKRPVPDSRPHAVRFGRSRTTAGGHRAGGYPDRSRRLPGIGDRSGKRARDRAEHPLQEGRCRGTAGVRQKTLPFSTPHSHGRGPDTARFPAVSEGAAAASSKRRTTGNLIKLNTLCVASGRRRSPPREFAAITTAYRMPSREACIGGT